MKIQDGNFIVTKEEIATLLSSEPKELAGYYNPERLKVIWAYLNCTHTQGKKPPITPKQYRELIKVLYKTLDADMRRNIEKYFIAFDLASDYARGVGRGAYHYLAELYALKANTAILNLLSMAYDFQRSFLRGDIMVLGKNKQRQGSIPMESGALQEYIAEDGCTYFTYDGKTKEDIQADQERAIKYLYENMRGFKADIEGMLKYLQELIPAQYLEPFDMDIKHTLPLSLQAYIYKMEKGFIEEAGVDINETTAGKGKHKIYPTYREVSVDARKVDAQYKACKKIIETRWQNE